MLKPISMLLLAFVATSLKAEDSTKKPSAHVPIPAKQNGRWGYVTPSGAWVIQPEYEEAWPFMSMEQDAGGPWRGQAKAKKDGRIGLLDQDGKWVLPPAYDDVECLGPEVEMTQAKLKGKVGMVDRQGKWVIEAKFDQMGWFGKNQVCEVKFNGKWGAINAKGDWVVQPTLDSLWGFAYGQESKAVQAGKAGLIGVDGRWIIQPGFEDIHAFGDRERTMAKQGGRWGFIGRDGHWVVEPCIEGDPLGRQSFAVQSHGKWGVITTDGSWVVRPEWDAVGSAGESGRPACFAVHRGDVSGLVGEDGTWLIPLECEAIEPMDGMWRVKVGGKWGVRDQQGKWLVRPTMEEIKTFSVYAGSMFAFRAKRDGKWGIYGDAEWLDHRTKPLPEGEVWLLPPQQEEIADVFPYKLAGVRVGRDWIIVDRQGKPVDGQKYEAMVDAGVGDPKVKQNGCWGLRSDKGTNWGLPPLFEEIGHWEYGQIISVKKAGKWGWANPKGEWVIPAVYDSVDVNGFIPTDRAHVDGPSQAIVQVAGKWGVIDREGKWVVQPIHGALSWEQNRNWVYACSGEFWKEGSLYGWLDPVTGKELIPVACDKLPFPGHQVRVKGKVGVVGEDGRWALEPVFDEVLPLRQEKGRFVSEMRFPTFFPPIRVRQGDRWGIMGEKGQWVLPLQFDAIWPLGKDGAAWAQQGGKWGRIRLDGTWLVKPAFEDVRSGDAWWMDDDF